jgi:hypothetical protein
MARFSQPIPDWLYVGPIDNTISPRSSTHVEASPECIQLIITSPPDLSETSLSSWSELFDMYDAVFRYCVRGLVWDGVLGIIITDRKWKGHIIRKHEFVGKIADQLDLELFAHKILIRTQKIDLYRLGFSHILCFRRRAHLHLRSAASKSMQFQRDLWGPFDAFKHFPTSRNSFPPEAIRLLVEAFSDRGDLVLDPFCGTGITQRVALGMGRRTQGYETDPKMRPFWREIYKDGGSTVG